MNSKILILVLSILTIPILASALEPIVLKGDRILVDKSNLYEINHKAREGKIIKKIPNVMFQESVVMSFQLFNPTTIDKTVIVELANPLLYYVKLSSINGTTITGRHERNKAENIEELNAFRNFRFKVDVNANDVLDVEIEAKTINFYQPMPVIIWNESHYLSDAKNALSMGTTIGVLYWILVMLPILVYFTRIKIVLLGVALIFSVILYIGYHLGFIYNLMMDFKPDTIYHHLLIGLQINVLLFMNWHYLIKYQSNIYTKRVMYMFRIIASIELTIFFTSIYAAFQVDTNIYFVKQMQFLMTVSSVIIFIPFFYLIKKFNETLSLKFRVFLVGIIPFSGLGIVYLLRNCGILNYQFGILNSNIRVFPINTVLPQLYCYGFFVFICVLLLLLFWHYRTIEENKLKFEKLTQTTKEEFPLSLINVDQEERTRLSQGLHDNVGVLLSIIKVKIGDLHSENKLSPVSNNKLISQLNEVSQYVRDISNQINPGSLKYVDLAVFFEDYFDELQYVNPNIKIKHQGLKFLLPIKGVKRYNLHRIISSVIPNKDQAIYCNAYNIAISKTETAMHLVADVNLKESTWVFLDVTKERFETLGTIVKAYQGNLRVIELSKTNYVIEIDLPLKHFY